MAAEIAKQGGHLSRVMLVVFGSPDLEADPITKQITHISEDVTAIKNALAKQAAERDGQKKLLGVIGVKDLPSVVALLLAVYALGDRFKWW